jgi:autotransporter-associated beta strand protein
LQGSTAGTGEIVGAIADSGGGATTLVKAGSGKWTLSGTCTYTGTTTISGGELAVVGLSSSSNVSVSADKNSIFSGSGAAGSVTVTAGTVSVGSASVLGTLSVGAVTFSDLCDFRVGVDGAGPTNDQLNSSSTIDFSTNTRLLVDSVTNSVVGTVYTIANATTSVAGTFVDLADGATINVSGRCLRVNYTATTVTLTDVGHRDQCKLLN